MSDIEKMEIEAFNEAMETEAPTVEGLQEECAELQKQNLLLVEQYKSLDERFMKEKARWQKYKSDLLEDNDALQRRNKLLDQMLSKTLANANKEKALKLVSIPKFVIVAAAALVAFIVTMELQKLNIVWPSLAFGIQCLSAMVISWCYAIIVERSKK